MSSPGPGYNPYAPPSPVAPAGWQSGPAPAPMPPIGEALRRLQHHVADPASLANDRRAVGPRVPPAGYIVGVLGVLFLLGGIATAVAGPDGGPAPFLLIVGFILTVLGAVIVFRFLGFALRDVPATPAKTAKSFLQAIGMGRFGYGWTCLCPTAREQTVFVPNLMPVATVLGPHVLRSEPEMKAYALAFARPQGSTVRSMAVKNVVEWPIQGDVTRVSAELHFQSWPRWVSVLMSLGFIACQLVGIVGAIILFTVRKTHKVRVTKTLIRAQNGVWYVYDANVFEDGVPI